MLLYEEAQTKPLLYRGVIPTCTVTKKLKTSLVESPLFIVMTFVECFWVLCFVNWIRIARYIYDLFMLYAHCIFITYEQLVKLLHLQ